MKLYWVKTPKIIAWLFRRFEWRFKTREKKVWLTFDDGPIPEVTPFVLDTLERYGAKASFFCIGDNVKKHPEIFEMVRAAGHAIGNHTYHHRNGWQTDYDTYIREVQQCADAIQGAHPKDQLIMRPPYAKIRRKQAHTILEMGYRIVMWDILSVDYDTTVTPQQCLDNVIRNIRPGSIVIFHDSQKAFPNMRFALEGTLEYLQKNGFTCEPLY